MSVKDTRFCADCPICGDTLPGTDDAGEVYESLQTQVVTLKLERPCCTLCAEPVPLERAREILDRGAPVVRRTS